MRTVLSRRGRQGLIGLLLLCGGLLAIPNAASAFTSQPLWNCRASALYTSINGNNRVEPLVANGNPSTSNNKSADRAQCANEDAGADSLPTPLGIGTDFIGAQTASAKTTIDPELGLAIDQKVTSQARVENLTLPLGAGTVIIGLQGVSSIATASCSNGAPAFAGVGDTSLTLNGQKVELNTLLSAVQQLLAPLNMLVDIKFNEQVKDANSLTVRGAHIRVLPRAGGAPLLDLVVAESRVTASADVCNPDKQLPGISGQVCPTGSKLDTLSGKCIIPAVNGGSGIIVVGLPFQGPSGGTVIGLKEAIKKYGRTTCLTRPGLPLYAVVGTSKADKITGTNKRDRILGLGGNDSLDGGRDVDCIEGNNGNDTVNGGIGSDSLYGGAGNDTMTGGLGNDLMDGGVGNDKVNGGSGIDRLIGGVGNDIINAGYNADRVSAGSGNDIVNIAVQGPPATVDCGSGRDKIRLNQVERKRIRSCEIRYTLADNKIIR